MAKEKKPLLVDILFSIGTFHGIKGSDCVKSADQKEKISALPKYFPRAHEGESVLQQMDDFSIKGRRGDAQYLQSSALPSI